jgi:hypothetical protein
MSQKLQEAVTAARAGETETAQRLLASILEENPDEVQAWFLLSHLVDSETKQMAYLKKTVALDPAHAKARQRLGQLQAGAVVAAAEAEAEAVSLPISTDPFDYEAQSEGDTIPDWMAGDEAAITAVLAHEAVADKEEPLDIPDWLQISLDEEDEEAAVEAITEVVEPAAEDAIEVARQAARRPDAPASTPDPEAGAAELARLNRILALLVIVAVLIVVVMVYLFFFL